MNYVQAQKFKLAGSGVTSTATSVILTSMKLPDATTNIAMADFGSIGYATMEPGTSKEEQISFTGISINVDTDVATLTGVTRGLRFVSPYDSVSANKFSHAGGSICVLANTAGFYGRIKTETEDAINTAGVGGNASETVKGLVEIATRAQATAGDSNGETGAVLVRPNNFGPLVETTTGVTHSLTTTTGQRVVVWASGEVSVGVGATVTVNLKYNAVTKHTVSLGSASADGSDRAFSLMYTETPGAATANITVDGGTLANVVIIVLKL